MPNVNRLIAFTLQSDQAETCNISLQHVDAEMKRTVALCSATRGVTPACAAIKLHG